MTARQRFRRLSLKCGWTTKKGRGCRLGAGLDTKHPGFGPCRIHGGARAHRAWELALDIARELDVTPWEALIKSVKIAAARAAWVDAQLAESVRRNDGDSAVPEVKGWLRESRAERTLLARIAKSAVDAGVAERLVRQTELEGEIVAEVIGRVIDRLELSAEQRITAFDEAHRQLLALEAPSGTPSTVEGEWKPLGDDDQPGRNDGGQGGS